MGLINISVLATGTIFLGEIAEPVMDTKNPQAKLMMGIPFTERPKSVIYDYKFDQGSDGGKRMKMTGFSRVQDVPGTNAAEMCLILQKRWEDADGNVYAKRVATAWERYDKSSGKWINAHEAEIHYGDITKILNINHIWLSLPEGKMLRIARTARARRFLSMKWVGLLRAKILHI